VQRNFLYKAKKGHYLCAIFILLFFIFIKNDNNIMRISISLLVIVIFLSSSCKNEPTNTPSATALKQMAEGIDTLTGKPIMAENPWKNNACALITDAELAKTFGIADPVKDVNTNTLPDQSFCLRKWNKLDWKERESSNDNPNNASNSPYNRVVIKVVNYFRDNLAQTAFETLKKEEASEIEEVAGVGEAAIWNNANTTLTIKKKSYALMITVNHTDVQHDNLVKAKELAALALVKM
jgi:hypothetical protein